jgi:dihydroxy-acid dehydratase
MAHECGIKFDLHDVAKIFKKTPYTPTRRAESTSPSIPHNVGGIPLSSRNC